MRNAAALLLAAAKNGDVAAARRALDGGARTDCTDKVRHAGLLDACAHQVLHHPRAPPWAQRVKSAVHASHSAARPRASFVARTCTRGRRRSGDPTRVTR